MNIPDASEMKQREQENDAAVMSALEALVEKRISAPGNTNQVKISARTMLDAVKNIQPDELIVIQNFIRTRLVKALQDKGYIASYGPIGVSNGERVVGLVITW